MTCMALCGNKRDTPCDTNLGLHPHSRLRLLRSQQELRGEDIWMPDLPFSSTCSVTLGKSLYPLWTLVF